MAHYFPHPIKKSGILLLFFAFALIASAQLSHGGRPLPLQADTRALMPHFFVEMPSFDAEGARTRSLHDRELFRSLEFAHKFHVDLRPDNSGITFTSGNMNVWRVGVHSSGAYSLNILFSQFRIPRGAMVFVYNADQTEILGSFTYLNNSDLNLLPIQPLSGDKLIVEYQEPINASFRGEIEIGEVNHDFIGILDMLRGWNPPEPGDPAQSCHPNIICFPNLFNVGRGVVGIVINGISFCTGVLVNNTTEDGTPFLMTATHCLNDDFRFRPGHFQSYTVSANRIVVFFNYDSPVCSRDIRGPLQMSLASSDSVLITESHDISLLRLKDDIPREFQPYFLGWNLSVSPPSPFHGIHHPSGGMKKVATSSNNVSLSTWGQWWGAPNAHWTVRWSEASTEGGSSGSPILDRNNRIIGTLTGGTSYCNPVRGADSFAALSRAWNVSGINTTVNSNRPLNNPNSLRHYLDPLNLGVTQFDGFDPFSQNPITRTQNFHFNNMIVQTMHNQVPLFSTNNTFGYSEFAEEFSADSGVRLYGVFIASAPTDHASQLDLQVRVYEGGENGPGHMLREQPFNFNFQRWLGGSFLDIGREMNHYVENFIRFDTPVSVSGRFFISISDANDVPGGFSVLNVEPRRPGLANPPSAWLRRSDGWVRSSENEHLPINTSLMIAPLGVGTITPPNGGDVPLEMMIWFSRSEQTIFIESTHYLSQWEVFYSNGQRVVHSHVGEASNVRRVSISAAHWARGVYIVRARTKDGESNVQSVLVN